MLGQAIFGQNILGQPDADDELIVPSWDVQCPDTTGWILVKQRNSSVERCTGINARDEGGITFPPIIIP